MRNKLAVAALVMFVVSSGLLKMVNAHDRPLTALPPAMGEFGQDGVDQAAVDAMATSSIARAGFAAR